MAFVEPQDEEVLVVAELDVEARLVLLDELVLEEHRLLLGAGDDHLDVAEQILEQRHEEAVVAPARVEVAADPRAQAGRLADVDHLAGPVLHEVAAGRSREGLERLTEGVVHRGNRN